MLRFAFLLSCISLSLVQTVSAQDIRNVELLAASCASCHGTRGKSVGGIPSLAGLDKLHFIEQMDQFINKNRSATVMHHHASGYTAQEIESLAQFFSQQN